LSKKRVFSFICFGVALFLFLFASVEKIKLVGEAPGSLSNQKALEIAKRRGLWPVLGNFRMTQNVDFSSEINESHLIRYVGVAYLGNIMIMILFLIIGVLLRTRFT
jgi:hypothetical protein